MTIETLILTDRRGKKNDILWLTLNRPEKLNALTFPLLGQMREILVDARFDRSIRCIVITGAGRGFCSGMDMSGAGNLEREAPPPDAGIDPEGYRLNFRHETETYIALKRVEVPIIAMINGPAVDAGFDLVSHIATSPSVPPPPAIKWPMSNAACTPTSADSGRCRRSSDGARQWNS